MTRYFKIPINAFRYFTADQVHPRGINKCNAVGFYTAEEVCDTQVVLTGRYAVENGRVAAHGQRTGFWVPEVAVASVAAGHTCTDLTVTVSAA